MLIIPERYLFEGKEMMINEKGDYDFINKQDIEDAKNVFGSQQNYRFYSSASDFVQE